MKPKSRRRRLVDVSRREAVTSQERCAQTARTLRQLASDVFGPHEIPRWPYIPLAAPLVLLAYLKLRRVL